MANVATWGVLAVVLVKLDQHRRRHHQEVSKGHGDRVGYHREALTQATEALEDKRGYVQTAVTKSHFSATVIVLNLRV